MREGVSERLIKFGQYYTRNTVKLVLPDSIYIRDNKCAQVGQKDRCARKAHLKICHKYTHFGSRPGESGPDCDSGPSLWKGDEQLSHHPLSCTVGPLM